MCTCGYIQYITYITHKEIPSPNTFNDKFYPNIQGRDNLNIKQANYSVGEEGIN